MWLSKLLRIREIDGLSSEVPETVRALLLPLDDPPLLAFPDLAVSSETRSSVFRVPASMPGTAAVFVKIYHRPPVLRAMKRLLQRSPARREHENLQRLARLGIPCVTSLGYLEFRRLGTARSSALVTAEVAGGVPLDRVLREWGPPERRAALAAVARTLARAHAAGYVDQDMKPRNLIVAPGREGLEARILDCPKGRRFRRKGRAFLSGVVDDLAMLDRHAQAEASPRERLRFVVRYAGKRPHPHSELRNLIAAIQRRRAVLERRHARHVRRRR